MKAIRHGPRCFEFHFPKLDTLALVEVHSTAVVIRATRNTFSEQQKICFIHELAAEGFIDESYQWFTGFGQGPFLAVRWLVDFSWAQLAATFVTRTRRFMLRLLLSAVLLWVILLIWLCLSS